MPRSLRQRVTERMHMGAMCGVVGGGRMWVRDRGRGNGKSESDERGVQHEHRAGAGASAGVAWRRGVDDDRRQAAQAV